MRQKRTFVEIDIFIRFKHIWTHLKGLHGNIPSMGISQLGISFVSSDLVFFSIN